MLTAAISLLIILTAAVSRRRPPGVDFSMGGERVDHAEAVTKFRREKLHLADVAKALGRTKEEHEADQKVVREFAAYFGEPAKQQTIRGGTTKEAVGTEPMMLKFFSGARDVDAGNERLTNLDSESEEDAHDEWAVESIEDRKEEEGGTVYLVRWAAPHDDEQTWESAEDVAGAAAKVQAFEQRLLV